MLAIDMILGVDQDWPDGFAYHPRAEMLTSPHHRLR
jgi:hypothetical protein